MPHPDWTAPSPAGEAPATSGAADPDARAVGRAVAAFAAALRLSCQAARDPSRPALANAAVAAHRAAQEWAEEAVRRAAGPPAA